MYIPTAAVGNSRSLATFGASGELMGFFYPHIDFAQNVREGMFAVWVQGSSGGRLEWCFGHGWQCRQSFVPRTNLLVTELRHSQLGLRVRVTDLLPPGEPVLVRRFELQREHLDQQVHLYQYLNLSLGDVDRRNAVHWLADRRILVQQFRDTVMAVGASKPFGVQCGTVVRGEESAVKQGMAGGVLQGGDQSMGDVDFAVGFEVDSSPKWETTLILAGGHTRVEATETAVRLRVIPFAKLQAAAFDRCKSTLDRATPCIVDEWREAYQRAVLSLMDLYDQQSGTFIAAPEFDSHYSYSGGYGYCWPRDAAVSALVAARLGFCDLTDRFFDWCKATQLADGHWFQRYWTHKAEAPSWCVQPDEIQLDQTCAVLHAAGRYARMLGDRRQAFVDRVRPLAERAAGAIMRHLDDTGLHKQAADLWECCYGSFAYTNAAVIAALREARDVFELDVPDLDRLRRVMIETFYLSDKKRWARRIDPDGRLDETADSSVLGLIEPWEALDLTEPGQRQLAVTALDFVADVLSVEVKGGRAILRFENESYMGGGPGCVNTLWLAQCRLKVAAVLDEPQRSKQIEQAKELVQVALANTNPVGQLPELIPNMDGLSYWAAPHGWASSLLIECALLLEEHACAKQQARSPSTNGELRMSNVE